MKKRTVTTSTRSLAVIDYWRDHGCTVAEIAEAADLPMPTVAHVVYTQPAMVDTHTERALLSARPRSARIGVTRKLRALAVMGWPLATITRYGASRSALQAARTTVPRFLTPAVQKAVEAAWADLWHTPGPSAHSRIAAARNGWSGPLAWDDIDDPSETPKGVGTDGWRDTVGSLEWLLDQGLTRAELPERLGVSDRSVQKICVRAGRADLWRRYQDSDRKEAA